MTPSTLSRSGSLRSELAERLRARKTVIVERWLDRINARVAINPDAIFPTEAILNHVPLLIDGIADFLERPDLELDSSVPVTAKAMELGALRHEQGFDVYEILKEHELLGNIIFSSLRPSAEELAEPREIGEALTAWEQIGEAVELIRQATVTHFLRLASEQVSEREARLRRFNRMVSHELKNRLGALRGAAQLLNEPWLAEEERSRFHHMILENSEQLQNVIANLEVLSRLDVDTRQTRNVLLPAAAAEAARQLRDPAQAKGVMIEIASDLPPVEVDAAAIELCLTNLISNAIKYSNPKAETRWVRVTGQLLYPSSEYGELVVRVADNGIGVPEAARARLFGYFYRAHAETVTETEGTGLGLSIVRETAESLGGRAWAEFPDEGGLTIAFAFPSRRLQDAAAAGTRRVEPTLAPGE